MQHSKKIASALMELKQSHVAASRAMAGAAAAQKQGLPESFSDGNGGRR
jgi:hypothetical protein